MEQWVRDGVAPPPSRYLRRQDGTLVRAAEVAWPNIPGVTSPRTSLAGTRGVNRLLPRDGGGGTPLPYLVPQVDRDGNELGSHRQLSQRRFKPAEEFGNIFPDTWFVIYARE